MVKNFNENNKYCMANFFPEVKMKWNKKSTPCMGKKFSEVKNEEKNCK